MSEFSDCHLLRTSDVEDVRSLIARVGCQAAIIGHTGDYWAFLVESDDHGALVGKNTDCLFHYQYGEDHGLWLHGYEATTQIFALDYDSQQGFEDIPQLLTEIMGFDILDAGSKEALSELVVHVQDSELMTAEEMRTALDLIFGCEFPRWRSARDFQNEGFEKELSDGLFIARTIEKPKVDEPPKLSPQQRLNQVLGEIPKRDVDPILYQQHKEYWQAGDYCDKRDKTGFMYSAYRMALPEQYRHHANLLVGGFGLPRQSAIDFYLGSKNEKIRERGNVTSNEEATLLLVRAFLGICDPKFNFAPYLARKKGGW